LSVRNQRFRLDAAGQLFDIKNDRGQNHDVAKQHPELVSSMQLAAQQFMAELAGAIGPDDRPFPVGYSRATLLPARDGRITGQIQRSGRAPNCSYFKNWTAKDDKIFWDVEVTQTGDYDVFAYYACPQADVGASFELSFNEARLQGKVTQANDPPLRGAEDDRTTNRGGESYVKSFKPMHVGTVRLTKGRGELALSAIDIPGTQVMELRLLNFVRK
jgi:hypothetical protein